MLSEADINSSESATFVDRDYKGYGGARSLRSRPPPLPDTQPAIRDPDQSPGALMYFCFSQAHKVFKGAEALGLMQSRAGVTPESLVDLKEALGLVLSEGANADPLPGDEQVSLRFYFDRRT